MKVRYSSNNSGGKWWLTDDDWKKLEAAGWKVEWAKDSELQIGVVDGRFIGALAMYASREGLSLRDAVDEWERITGASALSSGCPCCGQPHHFTEYDDEGNYVRSGPDASHDVTMTW